MSRVLVIEDDPILRKKICQILSSNGYQTAEAADGIEGIGLAWKESPDLIICDSELQKVDGFFVSAVLEKSISTARVPLILLLPQSSKEFKEEETKISSASSVVKPINRSKLMRAVEQILENREPLTLLTQQKRMELQVKAAQSLPHKLLTPLSVILGFSDLLLADKSISSISERSIEMIQEIHSAAQHLLHSVQNYILLSELHDVRNSPTRLQELKQSHVTGIRHLITDMAMERAIHDGRKADIEIQVEDGILKILEHHLYKLVEELLDNAFKFAAVGTIVTISGQHIPEKSQYRLQIIDRGIGLTGVQSTSEEKRPSLEKLTRQENPGIGLALVRNIVNLYEGSFRLFSSDEGETIAEVILPSITTNIDD